MKNTYNITIFKETNTDDNFVYKIDCKEEQTVNNIKSYIRWIQLVKSLAFYSPVTVFSEFTDNLKLEVEFNNPNKLKRKTDNPKDALVQIISESLAKSTLRDEDNIFMKDILESKYINMLPIQVESCYSGNTLEERINNIRQYIKVE